MKIFEVTAKETTPNMDKVLTALKKKLKDEGGAAGFDPLKAVAKKMDVNLTPAMLKGMSGIKMHRDGDYILEEATDDVGQKIYKDKKTRVVHSPVADKNISTVDQRVDKFASDRDRYNAGSDDAVMSTKGTNKLIAKSRNNIKQAYNKQDKIDQRSGAGTSYVTKGKPVKFKKNNRVSSADIQMDEEVTL